MRRIVILCLLLGVGGCADRAFRPADLFKTEIDFVADAHLHFSAEILDDLLTKLYLRNPVQLQRAPGRPSIAQRREQLFAESGRLVFDELGGREEIDAILLGLDADWQGDRIFAVMTGLTGMLRRSYNYESEFFVLSELDHQRLYNSARNVEILVWRLSQRRDESGDLLILTNSAQDESRNLSFERLFGKLIAIQDLLAKITANRTNRTITRLAQSVATAAFLP